MGYWWAIRVISAHNRHGSRWAIVGYWWAITQHQQRVTLWLLQRVAAIISPCPAPNTHSMHISLCFLSPLCEGGTSHLLCRPYICAFAAMESVVNLWQVAAMCEGDVHRRLSPQRSQNFGEWVVWKGVFVTHPKEKGIAEGSNRPEDGRQPRQSAKSVEKFVSHAVQNDPGCAR